MYIFWINVKKTSEVVHHSVVHHVTTWPNRTTQASPGPEVIVSSDKSVSNKAAIAVLAQEPSTTGAACQSGYCRRA